MNIRKKISLITKIIIFILIGSNQLGSQNNFVSKELFKAPTEDYIRNIPDDKFYILGAGDFLKLKVTEDAPELDQIFRVDGQGTTLLRRLGKIYIEGLTIKELTNILNKEYSKYLINPDVEITIERYRPIKYMLAEKLITRYSCTARFIKPYKLHRSISK